MWECITDSIKEREIILSYQNHYLAFIIIKLCSIMCASAIKYANVCLYACNVPVGPYEGQQWKTYAQMDHVEDHSNIPQINQLTQQTIK